MGCKLTTKKPTMEAMELKRATTGLQIVKNVIDILEEIEYKHEGRRSLVDFLDDQEAVVVSRTELRCFRGLQIMSFMKGASSSGRIAPLRREHGFPFHPDHSWEMVTGAVDWLIDINEMMHDEDFLSRIPVTGREVYETRLHHRDHEQDGTSGRDLARHLRLIVASRPTTSHTIEARGTDDPRTWASEGTRSPKKSSRRRTERGGMTGRVASGPAPLLVSSQSITFAIDP